MNKIQFRNNQQPDLSAENLNQMQENAQKAIDIPEGTIISNTTEGKLDKYLKLFTVNMNNQLYKTNTILFHISSVQSHGFNSICELTITTNSDNLGINEVYFSKKKVDYHANWNLKLIAIRESTFVVGVYMKVTSNYITPKIKILTYEKYNTETLTFANEEYFNTLPAGTQYICENYVKEIMNTIDSHNYSITIRVTVMDKVVCVHISSPGLTNILLAGVTTLATLPEEYRPTKSITQTCMTFNGRKFLFGISKEGNINISPIDSFVAEIGSQASISETITYIAI